MTHRITSLRQPMQSLFSYITILPEFFSDVVIPVLFGIAFLFFVINAVRFFIIGGHSEDGQEHAKSLMIYGLAAFVFLIIFWGIVELLTNSLGFGKQDPVCPDYLSGMPNNPCGEFR